MWFISYHVRGWKAWSQKVPCKWVVSMSYHLMVEGRRARPQEVTVTALVLLWSFHALCGSSFVTKTPPTFPQWTVTFQSILYWGHIETTTIQSASSFLLIPYFPTGRHKNKHFSNRGTKGTWCVRLFTTPYVPVSALLWRTCLIAEPHLTSSVTACLGLLSHTASKASGTGRR